MERLGRVRRRFGFDRNDLRRGVDRRQWAVGVGAAALFAGLAPTAATALAAQAYRNGVAAERQQAANHRIDVRVTESRTQDAVGMRHSYAVLSWTSPDGRTHTAVVPADKSVKPGMSQRIWVDGSGDLARAPRTRTDTVSTTAVTGTVAVAAVGLPLLAGYLFARRRYDRRRESLWDEGLSALTHGKTF
ncbi:hypothetical protein HGB48_15940 [Actinomadura latina]|uniref:Uncharacterized protein n=1 Tax=Actinomadura latina TaxID=163603 RepID=A0A846Z4R3_9ACTN|nr:hypothetical protein [Actinomadura latina]NKZ05226.1 hypothetical protein [Actinomadura latina]